MTLGLMTLNMTTLFITEKIVLLSVEFDPFDVVRLLDVSFY
jgi:hypothetical protein